MEEKVQVSYVNEAFFGFYLWLLAMQEKISELDKAYGEKAKELNKSIYTNMDKLRKCYLDAAREYGTLEEDSKGAS